MKPECELLWSESIPTDLASASTARQRRSRWQNAPQVCRFHPLDPNGCQTNLRTGRQDPFITLESALGPFNAWAAGMSSTRQYWAAQLGAAQVAEAQDLQRYTPSHMFG